MNLLLHPTADLANAAAAELLMQWLTTPGVRNVMVAGGNSPLDLYQRVAARRLALAHLSVFALDEYVGVPVEEPRTCTNLLRRCVAEAWGVPAHQFFGISSLEAEALASVTALERRIETAGGLDVIVLGLGQNGHLGFNEPGSAPDSGARVVALDPVSIEANRKWFDGRYAPAQGATVGLRTILAARRVLILAFGPHKAAAVHAMTRGPVSDQCPASFLQHHPCVHVFVDEVAAADLNPQR